MQCNLTKDVRDVLGIPEFAEARRWISSHPDYMGDPPTDGQLEAFFLCHPEYGGLTQADAAEVLDISVRSVRDRLNRFFAMFPHARFADNRHNGIPNVFQWVDEMETRVKMRF